MSSPLAIGAVSAVLRNLLDDGMIEAGAAMGSTVNVSAVAPDTIDVTNGDDTPRLNVFLYQVTTNSGWHNMGLPSRSGTTGERLTNAPLAIDLHYLLTAYGRADFQAEILLGYAMHLFHERPVLDRAAIRRALSPSPLDVSMLPPAFQALAAADLADQVEQIKVTPQPLSSDEMSRLWSAIQTHYRPSSAYQVSVVLIEGSRPAVTPLPVLSRGLRDPVTHRDRGVVVNPELLPAVPTLLGAGVAIPDVAARLGDEVIVPGIRLRGTGHVALVDHRLFDMPLVLAPVTINAAGNEARVTLPADAAAQAACAAGQLGLSLRFVPEGEASERTTNAVPLLLAPRAVLPPIAVTRGGTPSVVTVTLAAEPQARPEQRASLILDAAEAPAARRTAATDPLVFTFPDTLAAGQHWLRLRIDGVDSLLLDCSGPAPVFDPGQRLTVPA